MKKSIYFLFFLVFALLASSCDQQDPAPELSDQIYKDLQIELDISKKNLEAEVAQNKKVRQEQAEVAPQSGRKKFADRRVFDSSNQLDTYSQQTKYFDIKLEERKIYVRRRYLQSKLPGGASWPDPQEAKEYSLRLKLQRAKLDWDKKRVPRGTASDDKSKKNSSDQASEAAKPENQ